MDACRFLGDSEKGKFSGSKKYSTSSMKEVKKKLSCINKRINDLHHQRKFAYKNSVKVKKMVHNQINQIVRCLRARERAICSEVDEVYFSLDGSINDELLSIQSLYAHCQALFNHIEDFKEKSCVLRNIDMTLSKINVDEKPEVKPLTFLSDFEMMKVKASSYGYLEGDFVKKDDFVYVCEEKDNKLPGENFKLFHDKGFLKENCSTPNESVSSENCPLSKITDIDDFQIIDLLENMNCQDIDNVSVTDENGKLNCTLQTENKLSGLSSSRSENTFRIKEYNTFKSPSEICEINIDFNPEEEWKQILEMNKILSSWHEATPKEAVNDSKRKEKTFDKNCNSCKFLILKEASEWLHNSKSDKLEKEKSSEKMKNENNSTSPAEITKKSMKSYLAKDNIQKWLSDY